MYADELLKAFKPKLNDYYYDVLAMWLCAHSTYGMFKRRTKFEVEPSCHSMGYGITDTKTFDMITVYDKRSYMCARICSGR